MLLIPMHLHEGDNMMTWGDDLWHPPLLAALMPLQASQRHWCDSGWVYLFLDKEVVARRPSNTLPSPRRWLESLGSVIYPIRALVIVRVLVALGWGTDAAGTLLKVALLIRRRGW